MEFKDKLKQLRKERNVSQQALAEAVYVSRSAVAKWENGYGLPSEESYVALCNYFDVSADYFKTEKAEEVIIEKNKTLGRWKSALGAIALIVLTIISFAIPILIIKGNWGFTSQMAAGETWENAVCIKDDDYHIYLSTGMRDFGYGDMIDGFTPVRKHLYGWTVNEKAYSYRKVHIDNNHIGNLYSFKGNNCYHNIFIVTLYLGYHEYPECLFSEIKTVTIGDEVYDVQYNGYFQTEERVDFFTINGSFAIVDDGIIPYNNNYDYYMD